MKTHDNEEVESENLPFSADHSKYFNIDAIVSLGKITLLPNGRDIQNLSLRECLERWGDLGVAALANIDCMIPDPKLWLLDIKAKLICVFLGFQEKMGKWPKKEEYRSTRFTFDFDVVRSIIACIVKGKYKKCVDCG